VPESACRLRTSVMATHTTDQLDRVLDAFARVGRKLGVR
jgi:glycine C-acetyltransferase